MLSIGEFSNICKVSTKTLRYYAEIGLLEPSEVNPENGYRYYAIEQLEKMLFINRLKAYAFSLDEIKAIMQSEEIREMVHVEDYPNEYARCYGELFRRIAVDKLTMSGAPMVLFHSEKASSSGFDTEFAIPVKEYATGTRDFCPGLCLKTVVRGAYTELASVYTRQIQWAEKEGYRCTGALFEVYVTDPTQTENEKDNITEVYYPVKKIVRR